MTNRRVLLKSRPQGEPTRADFEIFDQPMPEPGDGEYLSRIIWMSLDPYMRSRMGIYCSTSSKKRPYGARFELAV